MAREVQVLAWCDVDMAEDRRVPMAASHEVVVDGKAYTVDLCEDHEAAIYKPFVALVAHGSAPAPKVAQNRAQRALAAYAPNGTKAKAGRPLSDLSKALPLGTRCLISTCGAAYDGRTQGALTQHMGTVHGFTLEDLGRVCPVCGEVKHPGNGLSNHVARTHPEVGPTALTGILAGWWWASENGDPHEVFTTTGYLPFLVDTPPLAPGATRVQVHP